MNDDLVKRAREFCIHTPLSKPMITKLADRIEELEADLRKMALDLIAADGQSQEAYQAQLLAEAKLAKAVTRLQHIAANKTTDELTVIEWDTYDMFPILDACISEARTTLAELTSSEAAYGEAKGDNDE